MVRIRLAPDLHLGLAQPRIAQGSVASAIGTTIVPQVHPVEVEVDASRLSEVLVVVAAVAELLLEMNRTMMRTRTSLKERRTSPGVKEVESLSKVQEAAKVMSPRERETLCATCSAALRRVAQPHPNNHDRVYSRAEGMF